MGCGGDLAPTPDAGMMCPMTPSTGCPCMIEAGSTQTTDGGACVCTTLQGCMGIRWACYDLAPGCPATLPQAYSSCSSALTCDYPRSDGLADERQCIQMQWIPVTVTTYCP